MDRRFRKSPEGGGQFFPTELPEFTHFPSNNQLGELRSASDRRHAALSEETGFSNAPALELEGKFQDVAAGRILDLCGSVGMLDLSRMTRVLEVIEDLGRVHTLDFTPPDWPTTTPSCHNGVCMPSDYGPQRVVSLQPSATVILAALGLLERVVACTKYCAEVCPEVRNSGRTMVADSWTAQSTQIIAARPDLVIAAVPYQETAVSEILKSGARFLGLAPKSLMDIYGDIAAIAGIMGKHEAGREVIDDMRRKIEDVREKTRGLAKPTIFCEEWGKPVIASQLWVVELVEAAGGQFIGQPGAQQDAAQLLRENPEVLAAAWCGAGDRVPLEKIVRDRGWQAMEAVQRGRVYCIRDEFLNTPAPTLIRGLEALAAALHPEIFPQAEGLRSMAAGATLPKC